MARRQTVRPGDCEGTNGPVRYEGAHAYCPECGAEVGTNTRVVTVGRRRVSSQIVTRHAAPKES